MNSIRPFEAIETLKFAAFSQFSINLRLRLHTPRCLGISNNHPRPSRHEN